MRPLERADYGRGFLDVLRVLTAVGDIGEEAWGERYSGMAASSDYFVLVIEETASRRCVGAGTLIVERKLCVQPTHQLIPPPPPSPPQRCRGQVPTR